MAPCSSVPLLSSGLCFVRAPSLVPLRQSLRHRNPIAPTPLPLPRTSSPRRARRLVPRASFLPGGDGFLNVGGPEVIIVFIVAWVVLGPQEMIRVSREAGSLLGKARSWAANTQKELRENVDVAAIEDELRGAVDAVRKPLESELERGEKEGARSKFQEQLERAEDPEQVSPWEAGLPAMNTKVSNDVPETLSAPSEDVPESEADEPAEVADDELERLESEYLATRKQLLRRKIDQMKREAEDLNGSSP